MNLPNQYFFCYSINLFREMKNNNMRYISKGTNPSTSRDFWVFERTDKLKSILDNWARTK